MKSWPYLLAATLILGGIIHIVAVLAFPSIVMHRLITGVDAQVGIGVPAHALRATEESRTVVRPSPDLIYTLCAFDVSEKPLHIAAPVPKDTYFSLSMFSDKTDNFFVVNDQQLQTDRVEVILVQNEEQVEALGGAPVVVAPSDRGVVLFRTLIQSDDRFEELNATRLEATCEAM